MLEVGRKRAWLYEDPYDGLDVMTEPPARIIYDETESAYRERLRAWDAAQPAVTMYPFVPVPDTRRDGPHAV